MEGGTVFRVDGLLCALTNLPDRTLNVALVEEDPTEPALALAAADRQFSGRGQLLGLDILEGRHPDVEAAARRMGLRPVASQPSMVRALKGFTPRSSPSGVTIRRVEGEADLESVADLQVEVWQWSPTVARRFVPVRALTDPGLAVYLAEMDGKPVASAVAHRDHGAVGIFGVGTVEWARRRGIGTAITGRAMADAASQADLAWLQATPDGRLVYERMGFRPAGDWVVWSR